MITASRTAESSARARATLARRGIRTTRLSLVPGRRSDRWVYRAELPDAAGCFLKVFGHADGFEREARALRVIPDGVGPVLLIADSATRTIVTRSISGVTASAVPAGVDCNELAIGVLDAFQRLLRVGVHGPVDPIPAPSGRVEQSVLVRLGQEAGHSVDRFRGWLSAEQPLLPCHGDLTPHNVIVTGRGVRLVDFEFFGVSHPLYDAAGLCLTPSLPMTADQRLALLDRFVTAVAREHPAVSTTTVLAAVTTWAVRFAARLHSDRPALDADLDWLAPLRIAASVTRELAPPGRGRRVPAQRERGTR